MRCSPSWSGWCTSGTGGSAASGFTAPRREAVSSGNRRANLGQGFGRTAIYAGPRLEPGEFVTGPAIIEETFTTIAVHPGWQAVLDDAGDYSLSVLDQTP